MLIKTEKANTWRCNGCLLVFTGSCSYYCFSCDVDLCNECFSSSLNKQVKNYNHPHELSVKDMTEFGFVCDICRTTNDKFRLRFRCKPCDFDICFKCRY